MDKLRIGTLTGGDTAGRLLPKLADLGFESFSLTYWESAHEADFAATAADVRRALDGRDVVISCLAPFGNPLSDDADRRARSIRGFERAIDAAHRFGTDLVTGFTGRVEGKSIPDCIQRFADVWGPLALRAKDRGVRLAFENCEMDGTWESGDWNIAHYPAAWELMFAALPMDNLGLEWEPCHQMVKLIDPIPQLRQWVGRMFHIHGKDATIDWDVLRTYGTGGPRQYAWHRTPGFGDSDWTRIIGILRAAGYRGTIDIEGFHDPVYRGELEMTGQVAGLRYLQRCRGGDFVPNPEV
jgi:sugar phosphate isomerase/epimerase